MKLKVRNALACEYIAMGAHKTFTLVNVYAGSISVKEFPATIPLAFYAEFLPPSAQHGSLDLRVMLNDEKIAHAEVAFDYEEGKVALIALPPLPLRFTKNATIRVIASGQGITKTTILEKDVALGENPEA